MSASSSRSVKDASKEDCENPGRRIDCHLPAREGRNPKREYPLSRQGGMKLWRLEAVRGAAAAYVVLGHLTHPYSGIFSLGQEAVMVFFLLSGFVIEYSTADALGQGFRPYFVRRFVRIYPVLISMFVLVVLLTRTDVTQPDFLQQFAGNVMMLQDFPHGKPNVIVPTLFAGALWSLHYEWWFYMLYYPLRRYLPGGSSAHVVGLAGVISAAFYFFHPIAPLRILVYLPVWWLGVVMARAYRESGKVTLHAAFNPAVYIVVICGLIGAKCLAARQAGLTLHAGIHPFLELRHIAGALIILLAAFLWQRCRWIGFSTLLGWGCWVAPISYALYIAHEPLLTEASYLAWCHPTIAQILYACILSLFCWATELRLYPYLRKKFVVRL